MKKNKVSDFHIINIQFLFNEFSGGKVCHYKKVPLINCIFFTSTYMSITDCHKSTKIERNGNLGRIKCDFFRLRSELDRTQFLPCNCNEFIPEI